MRGKVPRPISTSEDDRQILERWLRRPKTAQALATRARIVLACAEGKGNAAIAAEVGVTAWTVSKWRGRFFAQGPDGLLDEPRPGAPREIGDDDVERVITLTLETTPDAATHWSTRSMARRTGMSQSAISRIWRAFALQPHRTETFKLSKDPLFIEKVRDIVGLYMSPPGKALVLCVDEKSEVQALDRTAPLLPMRPGQIERRTHDYRRNGTTSLFAALDTASGKVIGSCQQQHRSVEFIKFLNQIDAAVPQDLDIHIILDNYATHKTPSVHRWLAKRPRYQLHFTPTSASWLNLVERWFAALTREATALRVFRSTRSWRRRSPVTWSE
jgi:transposase